MLRLAQYVETIHSAPAGTFEGSCVVQVRDIDAKTAAIGVEAQESYRANRDAGAGVDLDADLTTLANGFTREIDQRAPRGRDPKRRWVARTQLLKWEPGFWASNAAVKHAEANARVQILSPDAQVVESFEVRTVVIATAACPTSGCRANGGGAGLGIQVAAELRARVACAND